jgi:geranylgeranyl pyrophosphate synthase
MIEGEIAQSLNHARRRVASQEQYLRFIEMKTASLFKASAVAGGVLSRFSDEELENAKHFGRDFGIAFQILDDIADLDDPNGLFTLPIIHHLENGGDIEDVTRCITERDHAALQARLVKTGSIAYSMAFAENRLKAAMAEAEKVLTPADAFYVASISNEIVLKIKKGETYAF